MSVDYAERWFNRTMEFRAALQELLMYCAPVSDGLRSSGGSLEMQRAFKLLGWDDPMLVPPEDLCSRAGCGRPWTITDYNGIRLCRVHHEDK